MAIETFTYGQAGETKQTGIGILWRRVDKDDAKPRNVDHYSIGRAATVVPGTGPNKPADRGEFMLSARTGELMKGLNSASIALQLGERMVQAGLPEAELNVDSIRQAMLGLRFETELKPFKTVEGETKPKISPVKFLERVKIEQNGAAQAAPSSAAAKTAVDGDAVADKLRAFITELVAGAPDNTVKATEVATGVGKHFSDEAERAAAVKLLLKKDFKENIEGITFDGKAYKAAA